MAETTGLVNASGDVWVNWDLCVLFSCPVWEGPRCLGARWWDRYRFLRLVPTPVGWYFVALTLVRISNPGNVVGKRERRPDEIEEEGVDEDIVPKGKGIGAIHGLAPGTSDFEAVGLGVGFEVFVYEEPPGQEIEGDGARC